MCHRCLPRSALQVSPRHCLDTGKSGRYCSLSATWRIRRNRHADQRFGLSHISSNWAKPAARPCACDVDNASQALEWGPIIPRWPFSRMVTRDDIYGFCLPLAQKLIGAFPSDAGTAPSRIRLCDTMGYGVPWTRRGPARSVQRIARAFYPTKPASLLGESAGMAWATNRFPPCPGQWRNSLALWLRPRSNFSTHFRFGQRTGAPTPLERPHAHRIHISSREYEARLRIRPCLNDSGRIFTK